MMLEQVEVWHEWYGESARKDGVGVEEETKVSRPCCQLGKPKEEANLASASRGQETKKQKKKARWPGACGKQEEKWPAGHASKVREQARPSLAGHTRKGGRGKGPTASRKRMRNQAWSLWPMQEEKFAGEDGQQIVGPCEEKENCSRTPMRA